MAERFRAVTLSPGVIAGAALIVLVIGTLAVVAAQAGGLSALGPWDWRAVRFTLWQAALSATLSALLAVPVARALARRRFAGRGLLVTLMGLTHRHRGALAWRGSDLAALPTHARSRAGLGWVPQESFETGLCKTVQWYLDNPEWVAHVVSGTYQQWTQKNYGGRA